MTGPLPGVYGGNGTIAPGTAEYTWQGPGSIMRSAVTAAVLRTGATGIHMTRKHSPENVPVDHMNPDGKVLTLHAVTMYYILWT